MNRVEPQTVAARSPEKEVLKTADARDMAVVLTGVRHFSH